MNTYNKFIIKALWALVIIAGFLCIITSFLVWSRRIGLAKERDIKFKNMEMELKRTKLPPTTKGIFSLHKEYEWLQERQKEIWGLLKERSVPKKELTPLEFKEDLLSTGVKLRQFADIQGARIPGDLGFPEYTGGEIPEAGETAKLCEQLTIISGIVDLMLKNKAEEILSIKRVPYVYTSQKNLYKELVFEIEIRCVYENLLGVLNDLGNLGFYAVPRSIRLTKVDENRVKALLIIGVAELAV